MGRQGRIEFTEVKFTGKDPGAPKNYLVQMIERIDSALGRHLYSRRRWWFVEPVFGNLRQAKGMDHFTLRGRTKVNIQWKLYTIVHNIGKLVQFTERYA